MVLNMTELSVAQWSNAQLDAARKLCTDGVLHDWVFPTVLPVDSSLRVRFLAWNTADAARALAPEAIILQGEPVFVTAFIERYKDRTKCYSPCYEDGKFVQFRRF